MVVLGSSTLIKEVEGLLGGCLLSFPKQNLEKTSVNIELACENEETTS